jgi:hypothetical protein
MSINDQHSLITYRLAVNKTINNFCIKYYYNRTDVFIENARVEEAELGIRK